MLDSTQIVCGTSDPCVSLANMVLNSSQSGDDVVNGKFNDPVTDAVKDNEL